MAKKYTPAIVTWLRRRGQRPTRLILQDGRPILLFEPEPSARPKPRAAQVTRNVPQSHG